MIPFATAWITMDEFRAAMRQEFGRPIPLHYAVLTVLAVVLALLLLYWAHRRQESGRPPMPTHGPYRVFRGLVHRLGLTRRQRRWLVELARDLKLPNPITLLISERQFNHSIVRRSDHRIQSVQPTGMAPGGPVAAQVRQILFPKS